MDRLKRFFSISVMVMTVLSMSLVAVPAQAASSAESGDLIKMEGYSTVYYLGDNDERYVFPNESAFFSWYSDFSSVVTLPQEEVESYELAENVTMRPGNLIKRPVPTDKKVYAVTPGAELVHIPDEDTAEALYGENWTDKVVDVVDSYFVDYEKTGEEASADSYPAGSLVSPADSGDVYYINADGEAQLIDDEAAFEANRFDWDKVNEAPEGYTLPTEGETITGAVSSLIDTSQGGGVADGDDDDEPAAGSGLTVALSNNTPASATLPTGAAKVSFTTVNLTASNDGPVTIEEATFDRIGVGDEDELGDAYLYDGMTKVGKSEKVRDDQVEFDYLDYTIPAGETKTLTVRVNVDGTSGNHGFAIDEASDIVTNGASVSGSFPITGNQMSLSSIGSGMLEFGFENGVDDEVKVGKDQKTVAKFNLESKSFTGDGTLGVKDVEYGEDVAVMGVTLTNEGTADATDLENYKLFVDGEVVAELESADDDTVYMQFDEPYIIEEGEDENFSLKADITGGASDRTDEISFELDELEDVVGQGQTYGYFVGVMTSTGDLNTENSNATDVDIQTGDLSITESSNNPSSSNQARGAEDVVFLAAELAAEDEPLYITDLNLDIELDGTASSSLENYLENVTLYLDDERVAGPEDISAANGTDPATSIIEFDDEFLVDGTQELRVEADITDEAAFGDYSMSIDFETEGNVQAEDMDGDNISPEEISGDALGEDVTVSGPEPTLSKDGTYGDQDVVEDEEILAGRFILSAGDSEALDIDSYTVEFVTSGNDGDNTSVEDLRVNDEDKVSDPSSSEVFSVSEELAANDSKVISVYYTIKDGALSDDDTIQTKLEVEGEGTVSGDPFGANKFVEGQVMTLAKGTLTAEVDSATPDADIKLAQSTNQEVGAWKFETENTKYELRNVELTAFNDDASSTASTSNATSTVNTSAVTSISFNGVTKTAVNGVADFSDSITIEKDQKKVLKAQADFNNVDNIAEENVQFAITEFEYKSGDGSWKTWEAFDSGVAQYDFDFDSNTLLTEEVMEVYDSLITVSSDLGDSTRLQTETDIMEVTVSNDGGENNSDAIVKTLPIEANLTGEGSIASVQVLDDSDEVIAEESASASSSGVYSLDVESDGTISSNDSETFKIRVVSESLGTTDYITVKLLEEGFEWDDDQDRDPAIDGNLVDKLPSGSYELERDN